LDAAAAIAPTSGELAVALAHLRTVRAGADTTPIGIPEEARLHAAGLAIATFIDAAVTVVVESVTRCFYRFVWLAAQNRYRLTRPTGAARARAAATGTAATRAAANPAGG
jgi:hypothetical protein